jgi:hypothetical protein
MLLVDLKGGHACSGLVDRSWKGGEPTHIITLALLFSNAVKPEAVNWPAALNVSRNDQLRVRRFMVRGRRQQRDGHA